MTSDLDLRLKDESSAVVTFSFPPNPCVFQRYNIELNFVNLTSVVNGNCSNYHPENHTLEDDVTVSPLRHSMRKYYTSSNSSFGAQCPEVYYLIHGNVSVLIQINCRDLLLNFITFLAAATT